MQENKTLKITFTGDIMCEMPLLKGAKITKADYNFDYVFSGTKSLFSKSDYIVGNLETICADEKYGFTQDIYSFNTPISFAKSIKEAGVDLVTTATNHSLDRGVPGLINSLESLERVGLKSIGTYKEESDRDKPFVEEIKGVKVGFVNYTFGTNAHINGVELEENQLHHINLLKPQKDELERFKKKHNNKNVKSIIMRNLFKVISTGQWINIKRKLGLNYNTAYQDNYIDLIHDGYLAKLQSDIQKTKEVADIVIVCLHSGGQFNPEPGTYSKEVIKRIENMGADLLIGNHAHVVQKSEYINDMFAAYCLGNFSISPSSIYLIMDDYPEFSILLHIYIDCESKKIDKVTFTILKIVEEANGLLTVVPVTDIINENNKNKQEVEELKDIVLKVYNRFTNKNKANLNLKEEFLY